MADEMSDVIVADDNPLLVSVLSEIFKEGGYTVRTASDGFTVLALIRMRVPDILISDLNMPSMSGFELLSVVRRRFPSIAVVAMSGAYLGLDIPPGVAADGFYAKGTSSMARLFEILWTIKDQTTRHSLRAAAPIWIPGVPIRRGGIATIAVACPECLRPFSHHLHDTEPLRTEHSCPHCNHQIDLAIVKPLTDTDRTRLGISTNTAPIDTPAYIRQVC